VRPDAVKVIVQETSGKTLVETDAVLCVVALAPEAVHTALFGDAGIPEPKRDWQSSENWN
jgi:hypothetical protein